MTQLKAHPLVICIQNSNYPASLERRKIYETIPDSDAEKHHQLRVIDESGEDYLYPESYFIPVTLPKKVEETVIKAAWPESPLQCNPSLRTNLLPRCPMVQCLPRRSHATRAIHAGTKSTHNQPKISTGFSKALGNKPPWGPARTITATNVATATSTSVPRYTPMVKSSLMAYLFSIVRAMPRKILSREPVLRIHLEARVR